jgi:hypothetical protein
MRKECIKVKINRIINLCSYTSRALGRKAMGMGKKITDVLTGKVSGGDVTAECNLSRLIKEFS